MTRISSALNSSDLRHKEASCDADTLQALGLTAIHRPLGVLVMEVLESCAGDSFHDAARIRELTSAVLNLVQKQARRDRIKINLQAVADLMVRELVLNCCPRCGGRGFLPLVYGPNASDDLRGEECPDCSGSGRAKRDFKARVRASGHDHYSGALKRFYQALEIRLNEGEQMARFHYWLRFNPNGSDYEYWRKIKMAKKEIGGTKREIARLTA